MVSISKRAFWLALGLTLALPVVGEAQSEDDERARLHFQAGRSHFGEGAYDRARDEFQRAWELSHRPALLLNLATTHERLARYEDAIENIREYVRLSPDDPDVPQLERRIANLERLQRERRAPADEGRDETPEAEPSGEAPGPHASSAEVTPSTSGDDGLLLGAIAALSVGALGLGTLAIAGPLALVEDGALRDGCGATASCTPEQVSGADTLALVADVGMVVGVVGVAAGAVLLILALSGEDQPPATALLPWASPSEGGLLLRSQF